MQSYVCLSMYSRAFDSQFSTEIWLTFIAEHRNYQHKRYSAIRISQNVHSISIKSHNLKILIHENNKLINKRDETHENEVKRMISNLILMQFCCCYCIVLFHIFTNISDHEYAYRLLRTNFDWKMLQISRIWIMNV